MSASGPFHTGFPQPTIVVSIRTSFDGTTTWTLSPVSGSDEPELVLSREQEGGYQHAETREWRLRASQLENLARLIEEARLPLLSPGVMGVDGTTYSVEIRVGMGGGRGAGGRSRLRAGRCLRRSSGKSKGWVTWRNRDQGPLTTGLRLVYI